MVRFWPSLVLYSDVGSLAILVCLCKLGEMEWNLHSGINLCLPNIDINCVIREIFT